MGNETQNKNWLIYILIGVIIFGWFKYSKLRKENEYLNDYLSEYEYVLEMANDKIEEANSIIEDAQNYAWSSYQEMGEVLDNLYTVEVVSEP